MGGHGPFVYKDSRRPPPETHSEGTFLEKEDQHRDDWIRNGRGEGFLRKTENKKLGAYHSGYVRASFYTSAILPNPFSEERAFRPYKANRLIKIIKAGK